MMLVRYQTWNDGYILKTMYKRNGAKRTKKNCVANFVRLRKKIVSFAIVMLKERPILQL